LDSKLVKELLAVGKPPKKFDIRVPVMKAIARHLDGDLLHQTPKDYAYIVSLTLSFNKDGKIDTIYFSKDMNKNLLNILKPGSELTRKISDLGLVCPQYKGKLVLFPVIYKRLDDQALKYESQFLAGFENLWPEFGQADQKKEIVFLKPYVNTFTKRI